MQKHYEYLLIFSNSIQSSWQQIPFVPNQVVSDLREPWTSPCLNLGRLRPLEEILRDQRDASGPSGVCDLDQLEGSVVTLATPGNTVISSVAHSLVPVSHTDSPKLNVQE